jgi:hypothetical protein
MKRPEISRTGNDDLTENQKRQLEDALSMLVRMVTKTALREKLPLERSQYEEYRDSTVRTYQVTTAGRPDEPLALSVRAVVRISRLSRASAYEAVRTGQMPSLRFGKRIVVPRAALNRMLSQADNCTSDHR